MKRILICLAALAATAPALAQDARAFSRMRAADANRDGVITRHEFLTYRASQFGQMDRNDDGYISQRDAPRIAGFSPGAGQMEALITQFDANGDGLVSRGEFVNGPTLAFDRADVNNDNRVTRAELDAAAAAARARR